MTKIYLSYKVENAKGVYVPEDHITGKLWVENRSEKEKILKKVEARIVEHYEVYESRKVGKKTSKTAWWPERKTIQKDLLSKKYPIKAGSTLEYEFDIVIPIFRPKEQKHHRNWWLGLFFVQKTKLISIGGANPQDSVFVIPVYGSSTPLSVIQGIIGGSTKSIIEETAQSSTSTVSVNTSTYTDSLIQQATSQFKQSISTNTFQHLESYLPENDEILFNNLVTLSLETSGQTSRNWTSPLIISKHGMAFIQPSKEGGGKWDFLFKSWINVRKLMKPAKLGSSLDNVTGEISFKLKRGVFGRIYIQLIRGQNESRSDFKLRKKDFRKMVPEVYKTANKAEIWANDIEETFDNPGGYKETSISSQFESSESNASQSSNPVDDDKNWEWD